MGKGLGRTSRIAAFVAGLVLVLALPSIALAANVATFSSATPGSGKWTTSTKPTISVIVYDHYGVSSTASLRALYIGGIKQSTPTMTRISGTTRFKLSFTPSTALSQGSKTVKVTVKDVKGHTSTYSWTFKVDSIAPSTALVGAFPTYDTGDYTSMQLNATDAGSGIAYTYYTINGGAPVASTFVFAHFTPGTYTLKYWSVDVAGNIEGYHTLTATVSVLHSVLAAYAGVTCFQPGCHVGHDDTTTTISVTAIHEAVPGRTDNGCGICHSGTGIPTADCGASGCHSAADAATHQSVFGTPHAGVHDVGSPFAIASTTTPTACTNSGCHATTLVSSYTHTNCAVCHNSTDPRFSAIVTAALTNDTTVTCEACHITATVGVATGPTVDAIHNSFGAATDHAVSGACFTSGCHGGDISLMHASGVDKNGNPAPGCVACHPNSVTTTTRNGGDPSNDCDLCHTGISSLHNQTHTSVSSSVDSSVCVGCHGSDLVTAHNGVYTGQTDLGCFCHFDSSVAATMTILINSGGAPDCLACHTGQFAAHVGFTHVAAGGTESTACVACHGSDLPTAHNGVYTGQTDLGCFCHTDPSVAGEAAALAQTGQAQCVDCHKGADAAHGFANSTSTPAVSGHNTTTYGTVGAYSKFDGSQGVLLKDSAGATVTSTWATPTVNVFNPNARDDQGNPLTWSSVITCQDCHTGLNAAGPHGANDNWGIDPNYPYPYTMAVNSHADESGIAARINTATVSSTQVTPWPSGTTSVTVGSPTWSAMSAFRNTAMAAQGLAVADGANNGVTGNQYAVICAKCHKLFDFDNAYAAGNFSAGSHGYTFTNATGIGNDSNTAHSSHHWDLNNGAADCIDCHSAIPHGWVRPRLLVYGDTSPVTYVLGGTTHTVTPVADAYPYWQGRGTAGYGNGVSGMGPLSVLDQHTLSNGGALWTEAQCTACGEHADLSYLPASFSITATGTTALTWVGEMGPTYGIAQVYVDGVPTATVDLYSGSVVTSQALFTVTGLTSGTHKLEVDWTGTKNALSTGTAINVAGLLGNGPVSLVDEDKATFLGVWTTSPVGTGGGFSDNDFQYSSSAGGIGHIK